jgi:hypothetical protein
MRLPCARALVAIILTVPIGVLCASTCSRNINGTRQPGGELEAFSLRGLGRLPESWKQNPPFAGDNECGNAIADYRENIIQSYAKLADEQGITHDSAAWFADHRREIEVAALNPFAQAASLSILAEYERAPDCVEALGALNRWPGRSGVPIDDYLRQWEVSCAELQASPLLPGRLRKMLQIA